ncbi:MAG: DUF692 domain-containing protein [Sphingobium limneticum]
MRQLTVHGRGIGLRSEIAATLSCASPHPGIDFLEIAPENWMGIGGRRRAQLDSIADSYPLVAHGLSLSIGDTEPLNHAFVRDVRRFLDDYGIAIYSEHLSLSRDGTGYLYDLLPIPRRTENIDYLADRIARVQDITGRRLTLENVSYYHDYGAQMPEEDFLSALVQRSGCGILLDINNVYVNLRNHGIDGATFIRGLPGEAITYCHIAGHLECEGGFLLDTHGTPVVEPVIALGQLAWETHGPRPLLLERDNFVPTLETLVDELATIHNALAAHANAHA